MGGSTRFCRDCGSELRPGIQFCTVCGHTTAPRTPSARASEGGGGEPGSAATITSPAANDSEPEYRPWPEFEAASQPSGETVGPTPRGVVVSGSGPPSGANARPPRGGGANRARLLAIGAVVLAAAALAAVVIVVVHPFGHRPSPRPISQSSPAPTVNSRSGSASPSPSQSGSPSPSPSSSLSTQQAAAGLAALLAKSVTDRNAVNTAYNDVQACGPNLAQDVRTFRHAASSRTRLLGQLTSMPGQSALSQQMLGDLASAWRASISADKDFAAWAEDQVKAGCSANNQSDPNFVAANGPDQRATTSKTAFIGLWNPVASTYGLTTYQQNQL
jgi:hypothetical protein